MNEVVPCVSYQYPVLNLVHKGMGYNYTWAGSYVSAASPQTHE